MIAGGHATIYVYNIDRAVRFYTEALGLKLHLRGGDGWAEIDAGKGLILGLHATHEHSPQPGQRGSISVGLNVTEPLDQIVATLRERGVQFRGPIREDTAIRLAFFGDPDGNDLFLAEVQTPPTGS